MLNATIIPQKSRPTAVSDLRLTILPISFLSLVNIKSGINGNGIRRLKTTWLYTRMSKGLSPIINATVVGITLMTRITMRLNQGFSFVPSRPSSMHCPAKTPQHEDDQPEQSKVIAKTAAAANPKSGRRVR